MKLFFMESLQVFVLARPPVAAFILSLVAITVTIFLVAFYLKHQELVLDLHAQEEWNSLLQHLTSQKLCINVSDYNQSSRLRIKTELQFSPSKPSNGSCFPLNIDLLHTNQSLVTQKNERPVRLEGLVNLKGWNRSCQNVGSARVHNNMSVAVTLVIPPFPHEYSDTVSSPWLYFSDLHHIQPPLASLVHEDPCQNVTMSSEVTGNFVSFDATEHVVCRPENVIQLSPSISVFKPEIYLSLDSKLRIFSHLLQVGYLLLGIIFIMLLSAIIQGRTMALSQQHVLLPTKEIL